MVLPTKSGVSIIEPATIVAPLMTWAPFTVIGLFPFVVRIAVIGGGSGVSIAASDLAKLIPKLIWVTAKALSTAKTIAVLFFRGVIPLSLTKIPCSEYPFEQSF